MIHVTPPSTRLGRSGGFSTPFVVRRAVLTHLTAGLLALALVGCGASAQPWAVMKRAEGNPMAGVREWGILAIDFKAVKSDGEGHEAAVDEGFFEELEDEAGPFSTYPAEDESGYVIDPRVTFLTPGITGGVISSIAELHITVRLLHEGQLMEEIQFRARTQQEALDWGAISEAQRLERCAETIGTNLARYINRRVRG